MARRFWSRRRGRLQLLYRPVQGGPDETPRRLREAHLLGNSVEIAKVGRPFNAGSAWKGCQ